MCRKKERRKDSKNLQLEEVSKEMNQLEKNVGGCCHLEIPAERDLNLLSRGYSHQLGYACSYFFLLTIAGTSCASTGSVFLRVAITFAL